MPHPEKHRTHRIGWLRAAVMGANDGIVSTSSLLVGVATAEVGRTGILVAGLAGLVAGAMSMAAGEYVSVSTQSDTERADLEREREEIASNYDFELSELAAIYEDRGLEPPLARQVAEQLMIKNAVASHARDELGITSTSTARPVQAALTSAATFTVGAIIPLLSAVIAPPPLIVPVVSGTSLICLAFLGGSAARAAGAPVGVSILRVVFWGALAMGITAAVGAVFNVIA